MRNPMNYRSVSSIFQMFSAYFADTTNRFGMVICKNYVVDACSSGNSPVNNRRTTV